MNTGEMMKLAKLDPDKILYPGKQLSDFDPTKLVLDINRSGFPSLDRFKLLKRNRGELILIGARPSQGKSGLGFQIATSVAEYGKAHIFSLEMDHESIVARQASISLNKPLDYIQSGSARPEELNAAKASLERLNCIIDDRASLNIYQICDAARMQNRKSRTDLIVVDYIQIVATDQSDYSRAVALGKVSNELKNLAKELRIPVIALSQLNRQAEFREGGEPQLSDLKESGQLEQDADMVLLIHRSKDAPSTAKIIIAKNRNGPTGEIELQFAAGQCRFIDSETLD
jgi:replicative DNA helicase